MKTIEVEVTTRADTGKQAARKLRGEGRIPAVFYGFGIDSLPLSLNAADFLKKLGSDKPEGTFVKLKVKDDAGEVSSKLAVVKGFQVDTLKRSLVHADFYEIKMDRELTVDLPVHLVGHPLGIEDGGEIRELKREVKVSGLPGSLPDVIELDISGLVIGDTLKVGDISLAEGVTVLDGEDVALVTVAAVRVTELEEEIAEEVSDDEAEREESEESQPNIR
ncbi:MAG: 50S ribosomal protein L25 [Syntrophales bacterium]|nr:50S ribosomal protein L25 [Syntrophales bacterium]MCK9527416.1 50S ribosomal protein L25 [Syntrophales bacterium]MDX9921518.1 50S ribosomal protein L25 [Syntrophales bacterium]